jgi:PKD repeat protein
MTNYIWSVSAGGVITSSVNEILTVTWTATGPRTVSVNYTNGNGCTATVPTVYNVTINPLPVPVITGPAAACVTSSGNVYSTQTGMTNYVWAISAGGTITSGGGSTDNTATVTWTITGSRSISVSYTNGNGCTALTPVVYPVTVNPLPVPQILGPQAACATTTGHIYTTDSGMTGYTWSVSSGGTITAGGSAADNSVTVTWNTAGPQSISVNYTNGNGCTAASPAVYPVTVNPLPVPVITGNTAACQNSTGNIYTTEPGMSNYIWTVSAGGTVTAGGTTANNTILITWNTPGPQAVSVAYTNGNGCIAAAATVYPVTVNPLPVPAISGPASACVTSTGNVYTTEPGMTNYIWVLSTGGTIASGGGLGDNTITVTWVLTGAQSVGVRYTDANGCTAAVATVKPVTVNPLPVPALLGSAGECVGSSGNVYTTDAGMTGYVWAVSAGGTITSAGGSGDNTAVITWNTAGPQNVSVSYTNANGCTAGTPTVKPVTVHLLPVPTITGPVSVCETTAGNVYTTEVGMANYVWNVSAGGTVTAGGTGTNTVTVTWNTAGAQTVTVNYTNANSCAGATPAVKDVAVHALPVPVITGPAASCVGSVGNVYSTEAGMTAYVWAVSPGGVITAVGAGNETVTVTWTTVGPHTVSVNYTNTNGCTAAAPTVYNVTANPLPVPSLTGPASVCATSTGNVYTTETGMSGYSWTVSPGGSITAGGTSTDNTVTVTWNASGPGTVRVNYINGNGCTAVNPTIYPVTVNPLPVPVITGPAAICDESSGVYATETGMTLYTWVVSSGGTITSGGGASDNSVTVLWATPGPQSVSVNYSNSNGCRAAAPTVYSVTVNPLPVPVIAGPSSACFNSTGNLYTTEGGMTNYIWTVSAGGTVTSGGTTASNTVTVTWNTSGPQTVSVIYTNGNGCTSSPATVYNVTVNALPVPVINGPDPVCALSGGNVYTTEAGMSGYIWLISGGGTITSGGGTGDNTITVRWNIPGSQTVSVNYTDLNGCRAATATVKTLTVNPLPVPVITGVTPVCQNASGNVYSTQTGMTNYIWAVSPGGTITSGGGTGDNTATITWNTTGINSISVIYTDANGCTSAPASVFSVTVNPHPVPTVTGPVAVCVGTIGSLYFTEPGMTNYTWVVSAGGTIMAGGGLDDNTATITWNTAGPQSVSVNYTNLNGCEGVTPTLRSVSVNPLPVPLITGPALACEKSAGNIYLTEPGMANYVWTVSSGGTITAGGTSGNNSVTVYWQTTGAQSVSVSYTNGNGCTALAATVYDVTVNIPPIPVITGPATVCVSSEGNVYSTEAGMTNYIWTVSPGGIITAGGSGTESVTVTWTTQGARSVSVNYTGASGCSALTPTVYPVTVNTRPVVTISGPTSLCLNTSGVVYTTEPGYTGYTWAVSSGGTITSGGGSNDNTVTIWWNRAGAQSISVNFTDGNGCPAFTPTIYPVIVNPLPVPIIKGNASVCKNSVGNIYTTEPGMSNYTWVVSAGGIISAGGGLNNNTIIITWSETGPQNVSVLYTNGNGCFPAAATVYDVYVNALPVPVINGPSVVCAATAGNVYTTEAGMTSYIWSISAGGTITAGGGSGDNTVSITWNSAGSRSVSVNYTDTHGCRAEISTVYDILVNQLPIGILSGGETICPGESSVITVNIPVGAPPFTIDIENYPGSTIANYVSGTELTVTPAGTTTYRLVRIRDANGCEVIGSSPNMSGTATIIVRDLPSITSFSPPGPVCEFAPATFRVTVAGDNVEYQWYVDEGTGFTALTDNGSYIGVTMPTMQVVNTVRTLSGNKYHVVITGCNAQVTSPDGLLIINTAPEITVHPSDSTICLGAGAVMKADATGTGVTWQWYVNKGLGFVAVADDANFSGSATKTLTITDALASFNSWVFRAKATGTCGVPVFSNFARLMVIKPPVVTVQPVPRAICEGGYTSFLANGTGYLSVQWQVLNGATWTNISDDVVYSGTNSGQLAVFNPPVSLTGKQFRLALQGVCAAVYSNAVTLTVNANPVVNFPAPLDACGGVPLVINGNPQGGSGIYSTHRWTGDAGPLSNTAIQSPTFTAQISGDYYLNYSVVDNKGCSANGDLIIKVDSPSADFFRDISNGCDPLTVSFTKDMTGISKFWWDFDDGSPLDSLNANPVHVFANKNATTIGYYNVKLKVRSPAGCFDTYTSMITVYPKSDATFTASKLVVCSGNTVDFTALSGASKYYWEFGDGAAGYSANNATHLFLNLGRDPVVSEVRLTTQSFYNCPDVKTLKITVMPVPVAQFTAVPPTQVFNDAGNSVTFNNETNPGTWLFSWNFGDNKTSTEESPVHLYKTAGEITVSLLVKNTACADSIKHKIYITPPAPVANFDSIPPGCEPLSATFHNTSVNADLPGTVFHWDFGDGGVSSLKNPTYTYFESGMYRIKLTVTSPGGTSTKAHFISVYTSPKAYFDIAPKKVFVNDEKVRCFNLSEDATSFKWEFGDGDTTTVAEPLHQYRKSGTFDITLWAYSENGCSDKYVMSPGVTVEPPGKVVFPTVFTPNKDGPIDIYGLPTGGIEIDQFFFPPIREKIKDFKMQIFNRLGVLIFESHDIDVPWNGYYHNKLCQQGVYVWYVEGKYEDGQPFKMVGDITLLH